MNTAFFVLAYVYTIYHGWQYDITSPLNQVFDIRLTHGTQQLFSANITSTNIFNDTCEHESYRTNIQTLVMPVSCDYFSRACTIS